MRRLSLTIIILCVFVMSFQPDVMAVFNIELANLDSIDFGSLDMGETKDDVPSEGFVVTCTTDQSNAWYLKIRSEAALTHADNPASFIPDANLYWYGISSSIPGNTSLVTTQQDFTIERTVYTAPNTEGATGTDITLKFRVDIPQVIQSGTYSTNIVLTFTE